MGDGNSEENNAETGNYPFKRSFSWVVKMVVERYNSDLVNATFHAMGGESDPASASESSVEP